MWPVEARTHAAIGRPHRAVIKVEVWRGKTRLSADAPIISGGVTDTWATGVRRTLDMTVPASDQWRGWLTLGVEIRPFRGVDFGGGTGTIEMCPLGRFPVLSFTHPVGSKTLPVRASDRWERVMADTILYPMPAMRGTVESVVSKLVKDVDPYQSVFVQSLTSNALVPRALWDKSRHDTIVDLLRPVGGEIFFDRDARCVVRDRPEPGAAVVALTTGAGGTITAMTETVDWSKAYNTISVFSENTEVRLKPLVVAITNPNDPAYNLKISGGVKGGGVRSRRISSALWTTRQQMVHAGRVELLRTAGAAKQWSISCVPNPALDAGDTITIHSPGMPGQRVQIQTITHPLTAGELQQITTHNAADEDGAPQWTCALVGVVYESVSVMAANYVSCTNLELDIRVVHG